MAQVARLPRWDAWLDAAKAPFATELKLAPSDGVFSQRARVEMAEYTVTVRTSDLPDAGTDASVSVELVGSEGATGWTELGPSGRAFGRGAAEAIQIAGADVGVVERVSLKHNGTGRRGKWHLASLDVRHDGTGAVAKFACDAWLANENGVVAETTLIAAAGSATSTTKFKPRGRDYRVADGRGHGLEGVDRHPLRGHGGGLDPRARAARRALRFWRHGHVRVSRRDELRTSRR